MSDSFADLWNSTTPAQPQKSIPLSQQKPATPSYSQPKPKHDVFSLLSQSSTPTSRNGSVGPGTSRPGSSMNVLSSSSRPLTPSLSSGSAATSRPSSGASKAATSSGDAFNDLFSGSFGGAPKQAANMTIAERAAMAEKQRLASQSKSPAASAAQGSHQWAGLDALGGGPIAPTTTQTKNVVVDDSDDWGLGDFAAPVTAKPKPRPAAKADSLLDFGDFDAVPAAAPTSPRPPAAQQSDSGSLWDLDDFTSGSSHSSTPASTQSKAQEKYDSPDFDFDFGNREYASHRHHHHHHDEDDILGDLSKPVETIRVQSATSSSSTSTSSSRRKTPQASRTSSPPPHILGQIVEMGFSLQQAKIALAKTESGIDVQAALEMLLGDGGNATPPTATRTRGAAPSGDSPPRQRRFQYSDDEDEDYAVARRRRQQQQPQRQNTGASGEGKSTPNLQSQADEILAQASEIGLGVLSKASLFWKQGKEKVQKVYEERAGVGVGSTDQGFPPARTNSRDSRPKWMQDVAAHTEQAAESSRANGSSFRDDDEEEGSAFRDDDRPAPSRPQRAGPSSQPAPPRQAPQPQPEVDLFSSAPSEPAEPRAYVSKWRHKKPAADPARAPVAVPVRPSPTPAAAPPKPKRRLPSCPGHTLDIVRQNKTKGTEAFKLGQYSVAAEEYSKAITLLPDRHLLLVPLYTNRSLARVRCGECKAAVEDAGEALSIIAGAGDAWKGWNPSNESGGWDLGGDDQGEANGGFGVQRPKGSEWNDDWGRGVDLKDGWIKAVRRRAEAFEGMEKWTEARKDWEVLTGAGWVDGKTREDAVRGLGRCKKMVEGESGANGASSNGSGVAPRPAGVASKPKPRPKPTPAPAVVTSGEAVKAYREQVNALEAEDALKHQLKDTVEAKLLTWKKGKETNLRALLASLDIVLWEELIKDMGGKPDMATLITGGGVKKWYMKSVSRVHPDKLNASNSTVEQRMIAGGVFGTLNEAWLAFKQ